MDAVRIAAARGRAMQACAEGAMLALGCDEAMAAKLVAESGQQLELAAVNPPDSCVVAGTAVAVRAFQAQLGDRVFAKRLRSRRAFHSA